MAKNFHLGYGVISTTDIMKGGFILEYHGHHLEWKHMQQKMETYSVKECSYIFEYEVNNKKYWYAQLLCI